MKIMMKMLQKLVGLLAVGTALMLTGSVANAADGSGNQPPSVEGPCPKQNCSDLRDYNSCPPPQDDFPMEETGSPTISFLCRDCDGDCIFHAVDVTVFHYSYRKQGQVEYCDYTHYETSTNFCV